MDKGEEEDRKLLLKRLEKERKILELLEEVNMSIPSDLSFKLCYSQEDASACIYFSMLLSVFLFMYPL